MSSSKRNIYHHNKTESGSLVLPLYII